MNDSYTVMARRFRPQNFSEVVGQERIATTLQNAIREGRVAHGYLFSGARGVGKTSMARIFAKALNCPNAVDSIPCGECEICQSIAAGQDVDVIEIDAASNRTIDDIRGLRSNAGVKSMRSKYKVYILDEVHMLTKEAFNALLKTLEEPPPNVKFVLCTTEANKVPDTILSRCQKFDFGTIATDNIAIRLRQLAEAEGVRVDDDAISLVARRANGSMRDSQSLFDQLLAFGAEHVTAAEVHRLLGTAPDDRIVGLVDSLVMRQRAECLRLLHDALEQGVQLDAFFDQLIAYARDVMLAACGAADLPLMSVSDDCRPRIQEQAKAWGLQTTSAALQILAEAKGRMQRVTYGRALAELAIVRISMLEDLSRLDDLIAGWRSLETGTPTALPRPPLAPTVPRSLPVAAIVPAAPETEDVRPNGRAGSQLEDGVAAAAQHASAKPPVILEQPGAVNQTCVEADPVNMAAPPVRQPERPEKNVETAATEQATAPDFGSVTAAASPVIVEFQPGCEPDFFAQLISRTGDLTGAHLSKCQLHASFGPNRLEIVVPNGYNLGKQALNKPAELAKLQQLVAEISRQTIPTTVTMDTSVSVPTIGKPTPAKPVTSRKTVETPDDNFVRQVGAVFGVAAWQVQELVPAVVETALNAERVEAIEPPDIDTD